jgi:hypothetical protein
VPGYAYTRDAANIAQDTSPGLNLVAVNTFYGFKMDHTTSRLTVEKIAPGSGTAIDLPDDGAEADTLTYKHWVWNEYNLGFSWSGDRLLMEVK